MYSDRGELIRRLALKIHEEKKDEARLFKLKSAMGTWKFKTYIKPVLKVLWLAMKYR